MISNAVSYTHLDVYKRQVIACEHSGLLTDMKGNKIAFDCTDKHVS